MPKIEVSIDKVVEMMQLASVVRGDVLLERKYIEAAVRKVEADEAQCFIFVSGVPDVYNLALQEQAADSTKQ